MRAYFPLGKTEARDIDLSIRLHTEVRRCAREVLRKFKDRGDHYEYVGGMNTINDLEAAVDAVEGYEITGQS
jgi:hypothetical protein